MTLSILLLPAVGGYWLLTHWNYTRYQAVRESGYRLLFRSAVSGFFLFFISRIFVVILQERWRPFVSELWDFHFGEIVVVEEIFQEPFTLEVILSLGLAVLLPRFLNIFYKEGRGAERAAREAGDHVELLVQESINDQMPIEVTLRSRKVYIGLGLESGIGTSSGSDIALIPMYSGYRNEGTLDLSIDIDYLSVIWDFVKFDESQTSEVAGERRDSERFRVVIPVTEVVSARLFDEKVYDEFAENSNESEEVLE